jgi:predicted metal-dependent enzyme (double-stranded beta helix superfamily)
MNLDRFITEIRQARRNNDLTAIREIVAEAVRGEPLAGEIGDPSTSQVVHCESGLLVLHVVVRPEYCTAPHDHRTWSMVGVHRGREDNVFYQRLPQSPHIQETGGRSVGDGEVLTLADGAIHSIANPNGQDLVALHVYGANIFCLERSAWDPTTLEEERFDFVKHAGGPKVR